MIILPTERSYLSELKRLFPVHLAIVSVLLFCLSIISDIPGQPLVLHELVLNLMCLSVFVAFCYRSYLERQFISHCEKWAKSTIELNEDQSLKVRVNQNQFVRSVRIGCILSLFLAGAETLIPWNYIPAQYLAITIIATLNYFNLLAIIVCCVDEEAKVNHIAEKTKVI